MNWTENKAASACPMGSDDVFGPRVNEVCRSFDFTLLFEDAFLVCLPASVFFILSLPQILMLLSKREKLNSPHSKVLLSKLLTLTALSSLQVALIPTRALDYALKTRASIAAEIMLLVAAVAAALLSYLDHQKSLRPSTLLSLYLSSSAIMGIARIRTSWLISASHPVPVLMTAAFILTLSALALESVERKGGKNYEKIPAPEQVSGFWKRTSFIWLTATFRIGYAKVISPKDLPGLDTQLESQLLREKLTMTWAKYDPRARHSLLRSSFAAFIPSLLSSIVPRLCLSAFTFAQPFLISTSVSLVGENNPDWNYGRGLIAAWALTFFGVAVSTAVYQYQTFRFNTRIKGGLTGLIYQKAIQIRAAEAGEITAIALMGTDVERISLAFLSIHDLWGSLVDIAIALWLLERQLSLAALAPVIVVLICIACTFLLTEGSKISQRAWIEKVQARLRITTESLNGIKEVQMLGLSDVMSSAIQGARKAEIQTSRRYRKLLLLKVLFGNLPQNLAPVAAFAMYIAISIFWKNTTLLTAQAFTSVALITLLTQPINTFIHAIPAVYECVGSFDRIQEYCNYHADSDHRPPRPHIKSEVGGATGTPLLPQTPLKANDHIISFNGHSFGWDKTKPYNLKDVSVGIESGKFTILVGRVGSGKSTFLEAVLGETLSLPGSTLVSGPVAYCSQQPWLENRTIRENIIGVSIYNKAWYEKVLSVCALEQDLDNLENHDRTLVGSKGLNLSGGQKQRIALARALYSRSQVVLLDDVFSGMDAHTAGIVSTGLFGSEGLWRLHSTTVVLSTNSLTVMPLADVIITLEEGRITEVGPPAILLSNAGYVSTLGLQTAVSSAEPKHTTHSVIDDTYRQKSRISIKQATESDKTLDEMKRKNGDLSVYSYYFASSGLGTIALFVACIVVWVFCSRFPTIWLKWWSEANVKHPNQNVGMYLGVYVLIQLIGAGALSVALWVAFIRVIANSAYKLHFDLLETVVKAPLRFFTATDVGSLINRFSQDFELIDMALPAIMMNYTSMLFSSSATAIILLIFSKYLGVSVPIVGVLLYFLQKYYLHTSRQLRLLEIETKAPLYTHFLESVSGASTIRAFGWQSHYQERNSLLIDNSQCLAYLQKCVQYALSLALNVIVGILGVILIAIVVTWREKFSPGSVGISLVSVMTFGLYLARLIDLWTQMESSIGAVARVKNFKADTESEIKDSPQIPLPSWPTTGAITFHEVVASHRPIGEPVLNRINLHVLSGQHIAVCGRSGSGKSSLILSLLQMLQISSGHIFIDDVDISLLQCSTVRSGVNVVPQDAFLMPGTIRFNVDPSGKEVDDEITRALELVGLWQIVQEHGGLDQEMNTEAWSAGQKQLLCLARAIVRKGRILVLDEATSNVDNETEAIMQDIIDSEFKDCTVLAVMHRLNHITKYDKVAVFEKGALVEYDETAKLLGTDSKLAGLYKSSTG
ncbi:ABC transporter [Xylariaceae sp. FL0016]|nr:ABC transporter [Xylariaceae sp. FL0016]